MGLGQRSSNILAAWGQPSTDHENFPLKGPFLSCRVKKFSSGRVNKYLGQSRISPLFNTNFRILWVGSVNARLAHYLHKCSWVSSQTIFRLIFTWKNYRSFLKSWLERTRYFRLTCHLLQSWNRCNYGQENRQLDSKNLTKKCHPSFGCLDIWVDAST